MGARAAPAPPGPPPPRREVTDSPGPAAPPRAAPRPRPAGTDRAPARRTAPRGSRRGNGGARVTAEDAEPPPSVLGGRGAAGGWGGEEAPVKVVAAQRRGGVGERRAPALGRGRAMMDAAEGKFGAWKGQRGAGGALPVGEGPHPTAARGPRPPGWRWCAEIPPPMGLPAPAPALCEAAPPAWAGSRELMSAPVINGELRAREGKRGLRGGGVPPQRPRRGRERPGEPPSAAPYTSTCRPSRLPPPLPPPLSGRENPTSEANNEPAGLSLINTAPLMSR